MTFPTFAGDHLPGGQSFSLRCPAKAPRRPSVARRRERGFNRQPEPEGVAMYDHPIPDGLTPHEFRKHPVRQAIFHAAYSGSIPSQHELDALGLSPAARASVKAAAVKVAATHDEGEHQKAWGQADTAAAEIVADLPDEQLSPDYLASDPTAGITDPAQLADLVPRQ